MQVPNLLCDPCTGPDAAFYRYFAGTSQAAAQVSPIPIAPRIRRSHPAILPHRTDSTEAAETRVNPVGARG